MNLRPSLRRLLVLVAAVIACTAFTVSSYLDSRGVGAGGAAGGDARPEQPAATGDEAAPETHGSAAS